MITPLYAAFVGHTQNLGGVQEVLDKNISSVHAILRRLADKGVWGCHTPLARNSVGKSATFFVSVSKLAILYCLKYSNKVTTSSYLFWYHYNAKKGVGHIYSQSKCIIFKTSNSSPSLPISYLHREQGGIAPNNLHRLHILVHYILFSDVSIESYLI